MVEDEESVALTLSAVLAAEGYSVRAVGSATEALAELEREHFDVALLDLHIGTDSGLAILERLRARSSDTVALILTGYGSLESAVHALRFGATDYLLKPCDLGELKAAIARGLERRDRLKRLEEVETVRVELERAIRHAQQVRDDFLDYAAHELKTPLASLILAAERLQHALGGAAGDPGTSLNVVIAQAHRLARQVEDFITAAQLRHGELKLRRQRLDLASAIEQAVHAVQRLAADHRFRTELPERPVVALTDPLRLRQVLVHLLESAVACSPAGSTVTVRLRAADGEAQVTVLDQGAGIRSEDLPHPLDAADGGPLETVELRLGGPRLGLALCQALVGAQGGRLWAERPGDGPGSAVTVALPLADPAA